MRHWRHGDAATADATGRAHGAFSLVVYYSARYRSANADLLTTSANANVTGRVRAETIRYYNNKSNGKGRNNLQLAQNEVVSSLCKGSAELTQKVDSLRSYYLCTKQPSGKRRVSQNTSTLSEECSTTHAKLAKVV